jgi:hypothetical protein
MDQWDRALSKKWRARLRELGMLREKSLAILLWLPKRSGPVLHDTGLPAPYRVPNVASACGWETIKN